MWIQKTLISIKRKRSARQPRRRPLEKVGMSGGIKVERRPPPVYPALPQLPLERPLHEFDRQFSTQMEQKINLPLKRLHGESGGAMETMLRRPDQSLPPAKRRHLLEPVPVKKPPESFSTQQPRSALKHVRVPGFAEQHNIAVEPQKESPKLMSRISSLPGMSVTGRMPESTQKKCKAALLRLKGAVEKDGPHAAVIFELPKRTESPGYYKIIATPIDARTIEQRLERFEYGSVLDFAADVLLMLDNAARFYKSPEVKAYIRRLHVMYLQRMHHSFIDIDFTSLKTRPLSTISQTTIASTSSPRRQVSQDAALRSQPEPSVAVAARTATKAIEVKEERAASKSSTPTESKRSHKKGKAAQVVQKASERIKMKLVHGKGSSVGDSEEPRHPVDLVFCKKKRKERGKVLTRIRTINAVAPADTNIGKIIGTNRTASESDSRIGVKIAAKKVRTTGVSSSSGETSKHVGVMKAVAGMAGVLPIAAAAALRAPEKFPVPGLNRGGAAGILGFDHQWLTPVKKMRTDGGKRRPSHV